MSLLYRHTDFFEGATKEKGRRVPQPTTLISSRETDRLCPRPVLGVYAFRDPSLYRVH